MIDFVATTAPQILYKWREIEIIRIHGVSFKASYIEDMSSVLETFWSKGMVMSRPSITRDRNGDRLFGRVEMSKFAEEVWVGIRIVLVRLDDHR